MKEREAATCARVWRWIVALMALLSLAPAFANDTMSYTYDGLGRLIQVSHAGTAPNNGVSASYTYDKADNRTNVTVTGGTATTLTVSPTSLPNGTVGTAYSSTVTAAGGSPAYTYSVSAGVLPTGLSLNSSTGVISGTPSAAATYSFTIKATDSVANTGTQAYSVTISAAAVTLTLSPTTLPNGTAGTAYSQTITASGGTSPYTFSVSSGTLPTGLTLSSGGVLSGTPSTAGTYTFTAKATDSLSNIGTQSYTMTIGSSGGVCSGVSFSVNSVEGTEGGPLTFTVTKTGTTSSSCSVSYATANGTATAGSNYAAASGTLTFASSQTTQTITITTYGGLILPGKTRTMYLNLSNATAGGTISTSQGVGTLDSDGTLCATC